MASDGAEPYLKIVDVTKKFGDFTALQDISLDMFEKEFVCFLGPSGCGKTTLLRAIAGLDIQTAGQVFQKGRDISALPPSGRDFGIVFQSYALFPNLSVRDNVAYGLENQKVSKQKIEQRVTELLELVGLPDQGRKYPAQLSGGQQQRVALARALAPRPRIVLLDEPFSGLDASLRHQVRDQAAGILRDAGIATLMVTHDPEEAMYLADRIAVMCAGRLVEVAPREALFRDPIHPYTQALLTAVPDPDLDNPLDFDRVMDDRASVPAAWPAPFTIDDDHAPGLVDMGGEHFVRADNRVLTLRLAS